MNYAANASQQVEDVVFTWSLGNRCRRRQVRSARCRAVWEGVAASIGRPSCAPRHSPRLATI